MKFVNLTPHTINIYNTEKELVMSIPSSGVARCAVEKRQISNAEGVALFETAYGAVEGLPEMDTTYGTIIIVSLLVRQAMASRTDLYSPGELLRDEAGQPIGCIGLSR